MACTENRLSGFRESSRRLDAQSRPLRRPADRHPLSAITVFASRGIAESLGCGSDANSHYMALGFLSDPSRPRVAPADGAPPAIDALGKHSPSAILDVTFLACVCAMASPHHSLSPPTRFFYGASDVWCLVCGGGLGSLLFFFFSSSSSLARAAWCRPPKTLCSVGGSASRTPKFVMCVCAAVGCYAPLCGCCFPLPHGCGFGVATSVFNRFAHPAPCCFPWLATYSSS